MSEEIQEAIQIIRVAYDGIEIVLKVGSGSLQTMKSIGKGNVKQYLRSIAEDVTREFMMYD